MERTIVCKECGATFTISDNEAKWYEEKGFEVPKRCKDCRKSRRRNKSRENNKS